ncbi:site-2 protease family protein [Hymenobacter terrestris]|uniref:M50 family metallopeptidase n=1 Tax=Hymenobacter terrestris TaxID=2748310 RepID=A0ABX2Q8G1_9BACT|nr:site-2 protease family protein [Hymenobacter terrestris]NVO86522.1 M50 family metallopeptidase [Hymenobacter terrestris]
MKKPGILFFFACGLLGGLVGYGMARYLPDSQFRPVFQTSAGPAEGVAKFGVALLALWAALALHELGHLLTGLAQGFRFLLFVAGLLGVRRHPRTDRVQFYLNRDLALAGGVAATAPTRRGPHLRRQLAAICAAGPLASLLVAVGALTGGQYLLGTAALASPTGRVGIFFLIVLGLSSGLLLLATTIPTRTGPFFTDRARFFRLLGGGPAAATEQAQLELLAHTQSGQPYATLDSDQLALLLADEEPLVRCFAHFMAYYRSLDRAEELAALTHIRAADELANNQPQLFRDEISKERAFAEAFVARDTTAAEQAWHTIKPALRQTPTAQHYLVQAALALAHQNIQEARRLAHEGQQALPATSTKSEDALQAKVLRRLIEILPAETLQTTP